MDNWPHLGNEHIKKFLDKSLKKGVVSSSFIFNGPDNLGKTTTAHSFAEKLLNSQKDKLKLHGDFLEIRLEKDKKNISIDQVRKLISHLSLSPLLSKYKVGIIKHADFLSKEAANALLKTLEEPKKDTVILLISENYDFLPKTIVSRSQLLEFRPVDIDLIYDYLIKHYKASRSEAKKIARLSLGRPALALKFFENRDFTTSYNLKVERFAEVLRGDLNSRLKNVEEVFGNQLKGQEATKVAQRILQVWSGVLRDFMLLKYNLDDIVQHEILRKKYKDYSFRLDSRKFFEFFDTINEAGLQLKANVNPRLVLENVVVKIEF